MLTTFRLLNSVYMWITLVALLTFRQHPLQRVPHGLEGVINISTGITTIITSFKQQE